MTTPEERLYALGIELPKPPKAVANYVPYVRSGALIFISGQIALRDGAFRRGKLGKEISLEEGQEEARFCGINLLAQLSDAIGQLSKVKRVVKLGGFVAADPTFYDIPNVINGCSDLMVDVLGDTGRHARSAVACPVLPLNAAVEIDGVFEVE